MKKKFISLFAVLLLFAASGITQDLVLKGGTVLTITKGTIENGTVVIQKGKITAVGKDIVIPSGIKEINVTGKYVMPGIIGKAGSGRCRNAAAITDLEHHVLPA